MKKYKVAILGATGAVGREMMKVLAERDFPHRGAAPAGVSPVCGTGHPLEGPRPPRGAGL